MVYAGLFLAGLAGGYILACLMTSSKVDALQSDLWEATKEIERLKGGEDGQG